MPETRLWTSVTGARVEAKLGRVENETVVLETPDGQVFRIPLSQLSEADREVARGHAANEAETGDGRLPVFTSGPAAGHHALYRHARFDAVITPRGFLTIRPREGPEFLFAGPRLQQGDPRFEFVNTSSLEPGGSPVMNPREVRYTGSSEEGLRFEVIYTFEGNRICMVASIIDPPKPSPPARMWIRSAIPALDFIKPAHTPAEREALLRGYQLQYRQTGSRNTAQLDFHSSLTVHRRVDRVEVSGPWGGLRVIFEAENRREGNTFTLHNYRGRALSDGFSFTRVVDAGARPGTLCMTIE